MNLYVSNLMSNVTEDNLKKEFTAYGQVASCKIIMDRATGTSRGFAFVEMPQQAEAEKAMKELDGKNMDGKGISITEARQRTDRQAY
ncbi:RNA recognition motif. (a.k.a. RRM, RBD, or RNP domain) [Chitinophaga rupis]|uniref:RNA recognition motif. (A.k.a. RRM, RBD, or RNP domain) n=1 Tax=Chitinophaga rupis TaxID=573321 RepID=A0A1H7YCG5_9BACT|nr:MULTISPECIES: RNA-binding protein [Chitinophaga]SEM43018.1 RNA recognition motif. (a.k.a. RRM, RBD, or RNP domain) [Chitinophaga rupis]